MIVISYSYSETPGSKRMRESVAQQGYELAMLKTVDSPVKVMKELYECYKRAVTGHELMVYSDAADTYFQRRINVPTDYILYSTEKQCFPYPEMSKEFTAGSPWKYLNNGNYCGPLKLVIEFFERYNLHSITDNAQASAQRAYLAAKKEGFPIALDWMCTEFQSVAFEAPGEFEMKGGKLYNKITQTTPAILHGNGLTPLEKFIQ